MPNDGPPSSTPPNTTVTPQTLPAESVRLPSGPGHYSRLNPEPLTVIEAWGLGFHLGNVLKYIARAGYKAGETPLSDLKKARVYLDRLIQHMERNAR